MEQYKRAFARQRARDLAQHADTLLYKDKEIAALQHECRELEARLGTTKVPTTSGLTEDPYAHGMTQCDNGPEYNCKLRKYQL